MYIYPLLWHFVLLVHFIPAVYSRSASMSMVRAAQGDGEPVLGRALVQQACTLYSKCFDDGLWLSFNPINIVSVCRVPKTKSLLTRYIHLHAEPRLRQELVVVARSGPGHWHGNAHARPSAGQLSQSDWGDHTGPHLLSIQSSLGGQLDVSVTIYSPRNLGGQNIWWAQCTGDEMLLWDKTSQQH